MIFKGSVRRTDLDKAYVKLVTCLFDQIGRVASESVKTPREVVHFGMYASTCNATVLVNNHMPLSYPRILING